MRHYRFYDFATQGYLLVVAILLLVGDGERFSSRWYLMAGHVLGMVLVHILVWAGEKEGLPGWVRTLRRIYPVLGYFFFYRESEFLNLLFVNEYIDPQTIRFEEVIFGFQPSLQFMERWPWTWVSETFYAAYFSFYVMIAAIGFYLFFTDHGRFAQFISVMSLVFYGCYICFIFLPIIGPRLFFGELAGYNLPPELMPDPPIGFPESVQVGPFYQLMTLIYEHLEGTGGSVPSSHVAVAITTVCFSFLYVRRVRYPHLVLVVWLSLSTVYCRYHYAVDVLAGLVAAAILIPLGFYGHRWCEGRLGRCGEDSG